jgi:hypothetical protein
MMEPVAWRYRYKQWAETYWHYFTKEPRHKEADEIWEPLVRLSDAEARIAEITKWRDEWKDMATELKGLVEEWQGRALAAEALLKEAKTALEPFARYRTADGVTGMDGNTHLRIQDSHVLMCNMKSMADWAAIDPSTVITVGDFRAARAISDKIGVKDE